MKSLLSLLTLSLALVFAAGCGAKRAGIEKGFQKDTARAFVQFHESFKGSTELLGEAAYSLALVTGNEGALADLDDALIQLAGADLKDGNEGTLAAVDSVNSASGVASRGVIPNRRPATEEVIEIQNAYIYGKTAQELNAGASDSISNLIPLLQYEIENNRKAMASAVQALELVESAQVILGNQAGILSSILEKVEGAASSHNIDLAGPEQVVALKRVTAPSTLD